MIEITPDFAMKAAEEIVAQATQQAAETPKGKKGEETLQNIEEVSAFLGEKMGRITGVAAAAFLAGYVEGYENYVQEHGIDNEGRKLTGGAKPLSDCADCQCNYCARLEACKRHREGAAREDGDITPWPCVGCKKGSTFISCENDEPDCPDWQEMDGTNYT